MKVAILLLAAGRGSRLGADIPKAFLRLGTDTLLAHSAARLLAALPPHSTAELLVLVQPEDRATLVPGVTDRLRAITGAAREARFVDGGATRQESMQAGLAATSKDADLVLVHDAARALVPIASTRACIERAAQHGAAMLAIPATDTLKRVHDGVVAATIDRSEVWYAQTPQIARRELFLSAAQTAAASGFQVTDDASLLEHAGVAVHIVDGSTGNLKVTHPDDIPLALALLERDPTPLPPLSPPTNE